LNEIFQLIAKLSVILPNLIYFFRTLSLRLRCSILSAVEKSAKNIIKNTDKNVIASLKFDFFQIQLKFTLETMKHSSKLPV